MTTGRRGWHNDDPRWSVLENEAGGSMDDGAMAADDSADCLDPVLLAAARELRRPVTLDIALDARIMAAVDAEGAPGAQPSGLTAEWGVVTTPAQSEPAAIAPPATPATPSVTPVAPSPHPGAARRRAAAIWSWLREPRTLRVSPLGGLAGLTGLAGLAAVAVIGIVAVQRVDDGLAAGAGTTLAASPAGAIADPAQPAQPDIQVVQFVLVAPEARSVALVGDFNEWDSGATPLHAAGGGRRVWSVEVPLMPGRHRYAFVVDGEEWVPDPAAPRAPGADFGAPSSVVTVIDQRS